MRASFDNEWSRWNLNASFGMYRLVRAVPYLLLLPRISSTSVLTANQSRGSHFQFWAYELSQFSFCFAPRDAVVQKDWQ